MLLISKIYIRSNKIKLGSSYAYHALWPLSYDLDKIQDRDKSANRCNEVIMTSLHLFALLPAASSRHDLPRRVRRYVYVMTSQLRRIQTMHHHAKNAHERWLSNEHLSQVWKREWYQIIKQCCLTYVFQNHNVKYNNQIGGMCAVIFSTFTRGLCAYSARLLDDDVTAIDLSYLLRREFPNYTRPTEIEYSLYWCICPPLIYFFTCRIIATHGFLFVITRYILISYIHIRLMDMS